MERGLNVKVVIYMFQKIAKECLAGFTVAIVALPLAIAFGIAATGTSEGALVGLYGAILQVYLRRYLVVHLGRLQGQLDQLRLSQQGLLRRTD